MLRAGIIVAALAAVAFTPAVEAKSTAKSPAALYRALLTHPYGKLPSGFYSAKVGANDLNSADKKHHAIGAVLVEIDSADAAIYYTIYPTTRDARERITEKYSASGGDIRLVSYRDMGKVPGFKQPCRWANLTIEGKNAFGKKVRNGVTLMGIARGNVVISAATISTENEQSGDVPAAVKLLASALAHLNRLK